MEFTLGSLFDGSGGFPLATTMCGITPVWAAEVEPYPIAVTRSRFPNVKHLGDVSKVCGAHIEPVDIITFGSPCQDLSVAGKRAGLKHESHGDDETTRSGLFLEAVRIIREMREATNGAYPRFALWENVPGAFSSNKGDDFRVVCEELIKIVEPGAVMPTVPKNGWPYADCYCGDGWSLAYRVFDAQYWGVPQRRRRIHLVLDLRGGRAREVLFEREGVRGYFAPSGKAGESLAGNAGTGIATTDRANSDSGDTSRVGCGSIIPCTMKIRSGCEGGGKGALVQWNRSATLATNNDQYLFQPIVDSHILDDQGGRQISVRNDGKSPTLRAEMHGNVPCVLECAGFKAGQGAATRSIGWEDEKTPTLAAEAGGNSVPSVCIKQHLFENHSQDSRYKGPLDVCPMLPAQLGTGGNNQPFVVNEVIPINDKATRCQNGGPTRNGDGAGNGLGVGKPGDPAPTLSTGDRHAVLCMAHGPARAEILEDQCPTLTCNHEQPIVFDKEVYNSGENATGGHYIQASGPSPTLRTCIPPGICVHSIVRRLTPTECARLQGFADRWGHVDPKEDFTDEDYRFWLAVRNTHAAINGKLTKEYTKAQMLTWYNKLHTDSSEYKMWGNGIALPPALYCMQGMVDVLTGGYNLANQD